MKLVITSYVSALSPQLFLHVNDAEQLHQLYCLIVANTFFIFYL
jgi:hypothetical protein